MKYMVMECHPAYAVLMDEESRIIHAANLHYEVGQTVESPILIDDGKTTKHSGFITMKRCIAAAACAALMIGAGAVYYRGNYTAYTWIVVSAAADVSMEVSRSGKVLSVQPLNPDGEALLADYDCRGKDQTTVTSELIERAVENGYVQKGDTVHVYYEKEKNQDADDYQNNVERSIASYDLNADIRDDYSEEAPPPKPETKPHTPEDTAPAGVPLQPPAPHEDGADPKPPAPHEHEPESVPPEPPVKPDDPAHTPEPDHAAPQPDAEPPVPPHEGEKPVAPPDAEKPVAPPDGEKPAAPPEKDAEPLKPAIEAPVADGDSVSAVVKNV